MNPSLLLIPDRYKAAKLYSQIPDSGAGDLTFARNSNATRVNSAGLIEKVRTNLFAYSQEFNDAYWSKSGGGGAAAPVITANNTTAPDGTSTAEKVDLPALSGTQFSIISREPSVSGIHNASVFLKGAAGGEVVYLFWTPDGVNYVRTSCTLTTAWQRFNLSATTATNWGFGIGVDLRDSSQDDQAAQTFFVWGAQLETGDIATDYIPTTTAAVSVGITADIPRLDYTGGGCPSLLLEPQRANLTQFSEQLNNAYWNKTGSTATANVIASPDGFQNADLLTESATTADHAFFDIVSYFVSGTTYTLSFFAKANGRTKVEVVSANSGTCPTGRFDLVAKTATATTTSFGAKIEDYGNGWFRCSVSRVAPNTGLDVPYHAMVQSFGTITYAGDGASGVYFWGMQTEVGSYVSSYIPTLGSSVTRLADNASKTGISSLIGTEFTIFYDGVETTGGQATRYLVLKGSGGTYANAVFIEGSSSNTLALTVLNNSSLSVFSAISPSLTNGQRMKFAVRCKDNDFAFYVNGSLVAAQASGSVPTTADLYLGYYVDNADNYSLPTTAAIYTSGLSNAELATLTAL
jgi:hypothetical protein